MYEGVDDTRSRGKCATEPENPHHDGGKPFITGKLSSIRTTPVARFFRWAKSDDQSGPNVMSELIRLCGHCMVLAPGRLSRTLPQ